jgi:predicted nucleic acid-binding protein
MNEINYLDFTVSGDVASLQSYLIDTNILVIAQSTKETEEKRLRAAFIIDSGINKGNAYISIQNLVEFVNVMKNKLKSLADKEIMQSVEDFSTTFKQVHYSTITIVNAVDLSRVRQISFFDALLAQTMLENGIHIIYTENTKDFNKIPGIKAINPFTDKKIAKLWEKIKKQKLKYQVKQKW